jgi:hypothetical protein
MQQILDAGMVPVGAARAQASVFRGVRIQRIPESDELIHQFEKVIFGRVSGRHGKGFQTIGRWKVWSVSIWNR